MRRPTVVVLLVSAVSAVVAASCAQKNADCADTRECPGIDGVDGGGGPDVGPPPRECNLEDICPLDGTGVFVSPNGSDDNDGTKKKPFATFARALGRRINDAGPDAAASDAGMDAGASDAGATATRIYACAGTYAEDAPIEGNVAVYGGFSCTDWQFTGVRSVVVGKLPLRLRSATASLSDIDFRALPAVQPGTSSIAGVISNSTVRLLRTAFWSGAGQAGEDRTAAPPFSPATPGPNTGAFLNINPYCRESEGGSSGICNLKPGFAGRPEGLPPIPVGSDGRGGQEGSNCGLASNGVRGADGTTGGQAGAAATKLGALTADGWAPAGGSTGSRGATGQGGGGSTGTDVNCNNGSGGGMGGCGGAPGAGAMGGGSSIAVAIFKSQVTIEASQIRAENGGKGGNGGAGGQGQAGGTPYYGGTCADGTRVGGVGGAGGGGGGGGGGAGGMSVGILWAGTAPTLNGQSVMTAPTFDGIVSSNPGEGGASGAGGKAGNGGDPRADGKSPAPSIAGVAQAVLGLSADGAIIAGDHP